MSILQKRKESEAQADKRWTRVSSPGSVTSGPLTALPYAWDVAGGAESVWAGPTRGAGTVSKVSTVECIWPKSMCPPSCPTLCNPMAHSPPGSSIHGILQARILEWVVISSSRGSSWPRDGTTSPALADSFTIWVTKEAQLKSRDSLNHNFSSDLKVLWSWLCNLQNLILFAKVGITVILTSEGSHKEKKT